MKELLLVLGTLMDKFKTPLSFTLQRNTPTSLKINMLNDTAVSHYDIYVGTDGVNYY